jgi:methionyl aminopeptidase
MADSELLKKTEQLAIQESDDDEPVAAVPGAEGEKKKKKKKKKKATGAKPSDASPVTIPSSAPAPAAAAAAAHVTGVDGEFPEPTIPVSKQFGGKYPEGEIQQHAGEFNTHRISSAELREQERLYSSFYSDVRQAAEVHRQVCGDL